MSGLPDGASARIGVVVRHDALREEIGRALARAGHEVLLHSVVSGNADRSTTVPAVDVWVVDTEGIEDPRAALERWGAPVDRVILLESPGRRHGADRVACVLAKPFSLSTLERAVEDRLSRAEVAEGPFDPILQSTQPEMQRLLLRAERLSVLDVPVVLEGELGTGREALARSIHRRSRRGAEPVGVLSSATLAATPAADATARVSEAIAAARWGALLIGEPAEWPRAAQAALCAGLRAEEGRPRCLTMTRQPLVKHVAVGALPVELQYRLEAVTLCLPPLRERPLDAEHLCAAIARRIARSLGRETPSIEPGVIARLVEEGFPGNRIGLESRLRAAMIRGDQASPLLPDDLSGPGTTDRESAGSLASLDLKTLERETIVRALAHWKGNRTRASESLGISVRTLRNKIREYGLR